MKKNYIYLGLLLIATVCITLLFSTIYSKEENKICYLYERLNKITSEEFAEYILENPDSIIYISDKSNIVNNKFEKKFVNKLEKLGLIDNIVYLDKEDITKSLIETLSKDYAYEYKEKELPVLIVIIDNEVVDTIKVNKNSNADTIIDYEVFK